MPDPAQMDERMERAAANIADQAIRERWFTEELDNWLALQVAIIHALQTEHARTKEAELQRDHDLNCTCPICKRWKKQLVTSVLEAQQHMKEAAAKVAEDFYDDEDVRGTDVHLRIATAIRHEIAIREAP